MATAIGPPCGGEGEVTLRGSVDYERIISGAETTTTVSGERLSAEATDNSLLLGLNGVYRHGRFTIGAAVSARQELGSTDSEYAGFLNLGISFWSVLRQVLFAVVAAPSIRDGTRRLRFLHDLPVTGGGFSARDAESDDIRGAAQPGGRGSGSCSQISLKNP